MNLDYFFKNSKDNASLEFLLEKSRRSYLSKFHNYSLSFSIGLFSAVAILVISLILLCFVGVLGATKLGFNLVPMVDKYFLKLIIIGFSGPLIGNLLLGLYSSREDKPYKEKLEEKLKYFYQESVYMPILRELNVIDDEKITNNNEYRNFLIALNNKNLNDENIFYIVKKYKIYMELKNQDVTNDLLKEMKEKIVNGKSTVIKEDNRSMIFFK